MRKSYLIEKRAKESPPASPQEPQIKPESTPDIDTQIKNEVEVKPNLIPEDQSDKEPWEMIDDHLWDRTALKMWWGGYSNSEIGEAVFTSEEAVANRLSELRKTYTTKIVPYDNDRRKRLIEKAQKR